MASVICSPAVSRRSTRRATGSLKDEHLYREDLIADKTASLPRFDGVDVLPAPRKGSALANSPKFIDVVRPKYVLFGSQPRFNIPDREVFDRYVKKRATVLSTARSERGGEHDIVCSWSSRADLKCLYGQISANGQAEWRGRAADGQVITQTAVEQIINDAKKDRERGRKPAFGGTEAVHEGLKGADLHGIDLSGKDLSRFDLAGTRLTFANLKGAKLNGSTLSKHILNYADLSEADLTRATIDEAQARYLRANGAKFNEAQIQKTTFDNATLSRASFRRTVLSSVGLKNTAIDDALFEPTNFSLSDPQRAFVQVEDVDDINDLHTLRFEDLPTALVKIRKYFAIPGSAPKRGFHLCDRIRSSAPPGRSSGD